MEKNEKMISHSELLENFEYRPDGNLYWLTPRRRIRVGDKAGNLDKSGYLIIGFNRKYYLAHRLVWFYHYGVWPKNMIDHINGVKDDNRIENLRGATSQQNQFNRKSQGNSASQYKGVCWDKNAGKWRAYAKINYKQYHIGLYQTEEEAAKAYDDFVTNIHGSYQKENLQ